MPLPLFHTQSRRLPMNGSFDECVLQEISGACVETKPRGSAATCIISGSRGQPRVSLHFQCEQQKPWRWPANNAVVLLCACLQILLTTELNQKLTKAHQEDTQYGVYMQKNTCVRTWGLKRGEGVCSKGAYFWELTVTSITHS